MYAMPANLHQAQPILPILTNLAVTPAAVTAPAPSAAVVEESVAIRKTLAGDVNAFNQLVTTYQGLAYSVAYRILHNREAAADAVQDSFIKAFRALATFNGNSFKSWLSRIVVNTCYDVLKTPHHHATTGLNDLQSQSDDDVELVDPVERPEAYVQRVELRQWVELGIRALPPEQRVVIILADVHGYAYDEIVEITGASMGTIKSRISRGRAKLREFLQQQPERLPAGLRSYTL